MLFRETNAIYYESHMKYANIRSVSRMKSFRVLKQVVYIEPLDLKGLNSV
jgi:hypothetical protein